MKIKTNIKGIDIKFHFGLALFDIFCEELGNSIDDFSKMGDADFPKDKLIKMKKEIFYSSAKAHSELNDTPFSFINENGKEVNLKPIHFSHLNYDANFSQEFDKQLTKSLQANTPDVKVEAKQEEEKKLIGTE